MKRPRYTHRPRIHLVTRNAMGGVPSDALLSQVREHAEMGERVRVYRPGFRSYDVARNGPAFPILTAIVNAPTLRPDGSLLDAPGYDEATGLFFEAHRRRAVGRRGRYRHRQLHAPARRQ